MHFTGAILCAIASTIWLFCAGFWLIPTIIMPIGVMVACFIRVNWLFWIELSAFVSTYSPFSSTFNQSIGPLTN
jgi:hypothetical protein